MSNQVESAEGHNTSSANEDSTQIIEIDLANLSDIQKRSLLSVLGTFAAIIVYLLELGIFTGFMKNFIPSDYQILTDFVTNFIITFIPYLIVIFFMIEVFIAYQMLLNNKENLEFGAQIFDYTGLVLLAIVALFFISIVSIPSTPIVGSNHAINQTFPTIVELFLFLIIVFVLIELSLVPFYIRKKLGNQVTTK